MAKTTTTTRREKRNGYWQTATALRTGEFNLTVTSPEWSDGTRSVATMKVDRESAIRLAASLLDYARSTAK